MRVTRRIDGSGRWLSQRLEGKSGSDEYPVVFVHVTTVACCNLDTTSKHRSYVKLRMRTQVPVLWLSCQKISWHGTRTLKERLKEQDEKK